MKSSVKKGIAVLGIIIITIIVVAISAIKSQSTAPMTDSANGGIASKSACYIWNTEAGDTATLVLTTAGQNATGNFNFIPAEKDSKTGPITGTLSADGTMVTGWWNASGEGVTNNEQVNIQLTDTTAAVGFGEMKDNGDGTYVYADPAQISYAPILQKTDCSDLE